MSNPITDYEGHEFRGLFDRGVSLRAMTDPPADGADSGGDGTTMFGHFSVFDAWYEIHSWMEGHFLERVVAGSFKKTIKENLAAIKVAFDHGYDMQIGDKPLGPIDVLKEDEIGPYYEVPLLDAEYNHDFVLPALQGRTMDGRLFGSLLGASFRFMVMKDEWDMEPGVSAYNPDNLPERTIKEVRLYEFGPVVYPASPEATAMCSAAQRGMTDWYHDRHRERSLRSGRNIPGLPAGSTTGATDPAKPPIGHSEDLPTRSRAAVAAVTHRLKELSCT